MDYVETPSESSDIVIRGDQSKKNHKSGAKYQGTEWQVKDIEDDTVQQLQGKINFKRVKRGDNKNRKGIQNREKAQTLLSKESTNRHQNDQKDQKIESNREEILTVKGQSQNAYRMSLHRKICSIAQSDEEDQEEQIDIDKQDSKKQMIFYSSGVQKTIENKSNEKYIKNSLSFQVVRNQDGLNKLNPEFHMHFMRTNQYFYSAKMVSRNTQITFIISTKMNDFSENGAFYAGKIKTNFIGNQVCLFGPGYSPKMAKQKKLPIRKMMATILFKTHFFSSSRPRQFVVYMLKEGVDYYSLEGTDKSEEEKPLDKLYEIGVNRRFIEVMRNRAPKHLQKQNVYKMNFYGRVKMASQKNFILQDDVDNEDETNNRDEPEMKILFGKIFSDKFIMDISPSFTPLIGFGIALSNFGNKIGCQ